MEEILLEKCNSCKNEKLISHFTLISDFERSLGKKRKCLECIEKHKLKEPKLRQDKITKEDARKYQLKSNYNISPETYNNIFLKQGGKCAICNRHQTEFNTNLHVDHCHKTGKVRGILCHGCNVSLGLLKENETTILNLLKYIKFHNKEKGNQ